MAVILDGWKGQTPLEGSTVANHALLTRVLYRGAMFIYVKATNTPAANALCAFDSTTAYTVTSVTKTPVSVSAGVTWVTMVASSFYFVQCKGPKITFADGTTLSGTIVTDGSVATQGGFEPDTATNGAVKATTDEELNIGFSDTADVGTTLDTYWLDVRCATL